MPEHRILSERYEVRELLGRGGMAEVHAGLDTRLGRRVAIKLLRSDLARDPSFHERLKREAQSAAGLNHPGIVAVYDSGEETFTESGGSTVQVPFIVMEYVEGQTLREVLSTHGRLTVQEALDVAAGVLAPLDYSHRNGIVHRDIKPGNVMLTPEGDIKVMDFGIARAMSDTSATMTQTSAVMGTAQYLSPEQARGIKVDPRSDIYSMGCVLFELLTGEPPFTGDSPVAVAHQHVHEDPPWPSHVKPEIPRELDSVVLKAMSKNKDNRYQSAADLRADLIKVLAGGKPSAPLLLSDEERTEFIDTGPRKAMRADTGGTHRREDGDAEPPRRRSRKLMFGAVAAVLLLLAVLFVFWAPWNSDSARQVAVPDVAGLSAQDAQAALTKAGFQVKILDEPSTTIDAGHATHTAPGGDNVLAAEGSEVTLYISSGPPREKIPDVRGQTQDEAVASLNRLGFTNVKAVRVDSTAELKDKVVETAPMIGMEVPVSGVVELRIGNGPKVVTVPNLVGQTQEQARIYLEQIQLRMAVVQVDSDLPAGQIVSSSPNAGQEVDEGSVVQVSVSRGNMFVMPNLDGQTPSQASAALSRRGWQGTTLTQTPRNVPLTSPNGGKVVDQDPAPGTKVRKDSAISIVVGQPSLLPN